MALTPAPGFWVAHGHPKLDELMNRSDYAQGYLQILQRHPRARASDNTMRFGGPKVRATWLPADFVLGEDGEAASGAGGGVGAGGGGSAVAAGDDIPDLPFEG